MIRLFAGLVLLSSLLAAHGAEWVKIDGKEAHPTRVLAKLKPTQSVARLAAAAPDAAVTRTYSHIPGLVVLEVKDQQKLKAAVAGESDPAAGLKKTIADFKATGAFEYVEPDYVKRKSLTPTDRRFLDGTLWGLNNSGQLGGLVGADINVIRAWDITQGDTNLVLAVIDTGVNYNHQDLAAQMWRNPEETPGDGIDNDNNGFVDDIFGINSITDTGDPLDDDGHGSHCAGTIGAAANNNFEMVGVIWKVRIMALKFLGANGGSVSDEIQCINYALSKSVKLSNNSYGGYGFSQAEYDAFTAARLQGHLFIVAAGNESNNNDVNPPTPAGFDHDNIITVAALDRRDQIAGFSNFGLVSVDVGAPGVEIFSSYMGATNAYQFLQGTSMACPHVCGVAALAWAVDLGASYSEVRTRILDSAVPIPALAGRVATGGRVNAFGALGGNVDDILELSVTPPTGTFLRAGSSFPVSVKVRDAFNVNNAIVQGTFNGVTYNFLNNGVAPDGATNDGVYTATVTMPTAEGDYTLSINVEAPGKINGHIDVVYTAVLPPPNDYFAQAIRFPVLGGIREGDNRLASPEPGAQPGSAAYGPDLGEPLHAGVSNVRSLWWSWSSPTATPVIVDTAGTSFDDDAVLGVYTGSGSSVSNLFEVGSSIASANGPNGTRAPFVKFTAQPAVTYWIAVAQSQLGTNSPGNVIVRVQRNGDIDTTPPTVRVTNILSGTFIRTATNTIELSGVSNDPAPNASGVASVQIKVNGDQLFRSVIGTTNWTSGPIQLVNGLNTVYVVAFDRADNQSAVTEFTVTYIPQSVSNDLFANSTTLVGSSGVVTTSNTNATKEFGEQNHAGNQGGKSLWWNYRPAADGVLVLSTEGSSFDTLLALYTVNDETRDRAVSSAILVESSDNLGDETFSELGATVERGRLYYIAVDGFGNQSGNIRLEYRFAPLSIFKVATSAGPGGTIFPETQSLPAGSALTVRAFPDPYQQFKSFTLTTTNASTGEVTTQVSTNNPFTFELTGNSGAFAQFETKVFTDDFETGDFSKLPWEVSTYIPGPGPTRVPTWMVATVETNATTGALSRVARSIGSLPDDMSASLVLNVNLLPGFGSFEFHVSSETNSDFASFYVNDQLVREWSGEIPWNRFTFEIPVTEGATKLEWRYTKDFFLAEGQDGFFIDNLDVRLAPPPPITISISSTPPQITATAAPGTDLQLQVSSDLVSWTDFGDEKTVTSSGTVTFDLPALAAPQRFYQVVSP